MVLQGAFLALDRCPHCGIATPGMERKHLLHTKGGPSAHQRNWGVYECTRCGGIVLALSYVQKNAAKTETPVIQYWPAGQLIPESIPDRSRQLLNDAIQSPPGPAIMATASALDWMLKAKGYKDGHLYPRIEKAASDHLITQDMKTWAHEIRLDANDQRHADESAAIPVQEDKDRILEFALALAEILFELPARVAKGRAKTGDPTEA